ncbi:MAG TPA: TIM barrel protein [Spirochaetia bacterium]|nr:TIM barrel protein [Spirochaetia bacterium]
MKGNSAGIVRPYDHGIFSWFGYRFPLEERMRMIKEAGYAASSVWLGRTERMVREGERNLIPSIVRSLGLDFEYIHASYANCNKIWSDSPDEREIIRSDYLGDIAYCAEHRIPTLVVHISKGLNPPGVKESGLEVIADLVRASEDSGVVLAVENTRQPGHVDYILENIKSDHLAFCYDSSHDFLVGQPAGALLERWATRLRITHLSDNDGLSDKHWLPGLGNGPWERVARAFPVESFSGYLTLEVLPSSREFAGGMEFLLLGRERLRWFEALARKLRGAQAAPQSTEAAGHGAHDAMPDEEGHRSR